MDLGTLSERLGPQHSKSGSSPQPRAAEPPSRDIGVCPEGSGVSAWPTSAAKLQHLNLREGPDACLLARASAQSYFRSQAPESQCGKGVAGLFLDQIAGGMGLYN